MMLFGFGRVPGCLGLGLFFVGWLAVCPFCFWECEVEFSCGEPGGGVPSALRWMCCVCGGGLEFLCNI